LSQAEQLAAVPHLVSPQQPKDRAIERSAAAYRPVALRDIAFFMVATQRSRRANPAGFTSPV